MQLRSCLLYTVAFFFVGTVCLIIAASTITGNDRAASVERLKATLAAKGVSLDNSPSPSAPPLAGDAEEPVPPAPEATEDEAVQREFADLTAQFTERGEGETWKAMMELYSGDRPPGAWSEAEWSQMTAFIDGQQDLIEAIRRIAAAGQPLVTLEQPIDFTTDMAHLANTRGMARLLAMDGLAGSRTNDLDRSLVDIEACLDLAGAVSRDGIVISDLVAIAITGIAHATLRDAISPGALNAAQTTALVDTLGQSYGRDAFATALAVEAGVGVRFFEDLRNGKEPAGAPGAVGTIFGSVLARPLLNLDQTAHADAMNTLINAADRPYYEVRGELEGLEESLSSGFPFVRPMTRILTPALSNVVATQARNVASVDLMRMGLLLELHYAETGRYPDSLDAISVGLGGSVPLDPFTGEPYRYLPQGGTMQLYSLGRNEADDGGVHAWRDGDWVWRGHKAE